MSRELRVIDGLPLREWLLPRLTGGKGTVSGLVPEGYPAYARILHAPRLTNGQYITWQQVADIVGGTIHPQVQWHRLVGHSEELTALECAGMAVLAPSVGSLDERSQVGLMASLAGRTGAHNDCCFAYAAVATVIGIGSRDEVEGCSANWDVGEIFSVVAPALEVDDLDYLILGGPVTSMPFPGQCLKIFPDPSRGVLAPTSPNLMWATDRSWVSATDPEFDSTIVGGSEQLVESLVASRSVEALRIPPNGRLTARSDRIN